MRRERICCPNPNGVTIRDLADMQGVLTYLGAVPDMPNTREDSLTVVAHEAVELHPLCWTTSDPALRR